MNFENLDLNITIIGGGSLGIVCASVFSSQGHRVSLLTSHPSKWSKDICSVDLDGKEFVGRLECVTSKPAEVIPQSDIVLLCIPGYLIEKSIKDIKPYLRSETALGSIVSSTGFFFIAHEIFKTETQPLFGFQRVPFIARVGEYGKKGLILGYKPSLNAATENVGDSGAFVVALSKMFMTPVNLLDNYYEASLTNSNPILHTGRLYSMWHGKESYEWERNSKFYNEWTDEDSEILIKMDEEFMSLLKLIKVDKIPPLLEYYESHDAHSLTEKIRSIPAFKNILSPMKEVNGRWKIDFESRYFTEDFGFGLRFIYDLAKKHNIKTPMIDEVYRWGMEWSAKNS